MTKTILEEYLPYSSLARTDELVSENSELMQKMHILEQQLQEANEVIESLRTYDFTVADENAEAYQVKWNVKAERFYKNKKWGVK